MRKKYDDAQRKATAVDSSFKKNNQQNVLNASLFSSGIQLLNMFRASYLVIWHDAICKARAHTHTKMKEKTKPP